MKPKGELMASLRERRRRAGWIRLEFWVPKDTAWAVKSYVKQLLGKRTPDSGNGSKK